MDSENAVMAAFEAQYAGSLPIGLRPAALTTLTIRPLPRLTMSGITAREQLTTPPKLTDITRSTSSRVVSKIDRRSSRPALFTSRSTREYRWWTVLNSRATAWGSETSVENTDDPGETGRTSSKKHS